MAARKPERPGAGKRRESARTPAKAPSNPAVKAVKAAARAVKAVKAAPRAVKAAPRAVKAPPKVVTVVKVAPKAKRAPKLELQTREQAQRVFARLRAHHPDAHCELAHENPFQLVVATVLSAQSTDVMVNRITPDLFRAFPSPEALAKADPAVVEQKLNRIGMFRQKTRNIIGLAKGLVERHGGEVPRSLDALVALPGVGRKTANVVLGVAFGTPEGVVVDTHVQRISQRLGWTRETEPVPIEQDLMRAFPREDWDMLSHVLIFHGRRLCTARAPACAACPVNDACPSAFRAEQVGRKAPRVRLRT